MKAVIVGYGSIGKRHSRNISKFKNIQCFVVTNRKRVKFPSKNFQKFSSLDKCLKLNPDIGLVTKVVPAEELMASSVELARQLSKGATLAMGMAKRGMYKSRIGQLEAALEFESYGQAMLRQTADHAEGVKAFIEKRTPVFTGS